MANPQALDLEAVRLLVREYRNLSLDSLSRLGRARVSSPEQKEAVYLVLLQRNAPSKVRA